MEKTVKIEREYYDKIKELADASGRTVVATVSSVLGAGLDELDDLGEAINNIQERKIGNPTNASGLDFIATEQANARHEEEEEEEEEAPPANHSWVWIIGALLAFAALRQTVLKAQNNALTNGG